MQDDGDTPYDQISDACLDVERVLSALNQDLADIEALEDLMRD